MRLLRERAEAAGLLAVGTSAALALGWRGGSIAGWLIAGPALAGLVLLWLSGRTRRRERAALDAGVRLLLERLGGTPSGSTARDLEQCARLAADRESLERARAEQALAVLRGVADPVIATDESGRAVLWNPACADLFAPRGIVAGDAVDSLFTSRELLDVHAGALAGRSGRCSVRLASRNGPRVHEVWAIPIERGAVLTLRDVTESATAAQLKTDFVANASHELRTPLTAIRAAVETLADQAREDPDAARWLMEKITGNLDRLDELTRDLLDLSRLESPEALVRIVPARASEIVESAFADLRPLFERRRLSLAVDLDGALERLRTDPNLLALILKNLLDNAGKFAFEGTEVRVTGRARGGDARFEVSDRGVGIPLEHQPRVFERFYQVDEARAGGGERGTGLGLAIVKHAAKALGGSVGLESVWQRGTTVWVELPGCVGG